MWSGHSFVILNTDQGNPGIVLDPGLINSTEKSTIPFSRKTDLFCCFSFLEAVFFSIIKYPSEQHDLELVAFPLVCLILLNIFYVVENYVFFEIGNVFSLQSRNVIIH